MRGDDYDAFIEEFVAAVTARWPNVLLQWEDFAGPNAARLLHRYRDRLLTFNDDIQGTAAAAFGTLLAAINVTGVPLTEQRIVILGAGAPGIGIASLLIRAMLDAGLNEADARRGIYAVGRGGLLVEDTLGVTPAQAPFVQARRNIADWVLRMDDEIDLLDVVSNARPTVLIGVSGQAGAFSEPVVRAMAKHVHRPIIFPLSNPTSLSEAVPEQLANWTNGRALIGTGSPFAPVQCNGRTVIVNQTNNSYIFPGVGLGVIAARARRVTDAMFVIAGRALADLSPAKTDEDGRLLPPVDQLRAVASAVAFAVARQAQAEGVADPSSDDELRARIREHVWEPSYRTYRKLV